MVVHDAYAAADTETLRNLWLLQFGHNWVDSSALLEFGDLNGGVECRTTPSFDLYCELLNRGELEVHKPATIDKVARIKE